METDKPDTSKGVNGPAADTATSPKESPTFTKAQLDKAVNDALSARGRELKAIRDELAELRQVADSVEELKYADDPDALARHRSGREKDKVIAEQRRRLEDLEDQVKTILSSRKEEPALEKTEPVAPTGAKSTKPEKPEEGPVVIDLKTDSGVTAGGGLSLKTLLTKDVRHMTQAELREHRVAVLNAHKQQGG